MNHLAENDGQVDYAATIFRGESEWHFVLSLGASTVTVSTDCVDADPDAKNQMLALAKTLAKRKDDEPWPRRILRWRQPGVR